MLDMFLCTDLVVMLTSTRGGTMGGPGWASVPFQAISGFYPAHLDSILCCLKIFLTFVLPLSEKYHGFPCYLV